MRHTAISNRASSVLGVARRKSTRGEQHRNGALSGDVAAANKRKKLYAVGVDYDEDDDDNNATPEKASAAAAASGTEPANAERA